MSGETIWCHFVLANFLNDDIMTIMNSYWIDSVFTLALKPSASRRVCLICTGTGFALAMMILHSFHLYKQVDNKFEWERKNLFVFYIWQSWAVLHCWITLPLQKIYLVDVVWLLLQGILMSNVCNNPIMIQQLLLTLFFIDNETKPNTIIESFPCWNSCVWVHDCYISSLFMFCINDFTLFYGYH